MQLPVGFQVEGQKEADSDIQYVLKLNKNIYGLQQVSFNWYEKPIKLIVNRYFKQSTIDPCLHIGNFMIVLTYVDDCIIVVPYKVDIDAFIQSMKNRPEKFVLTDEWYINKLLGIEITHIDEKIVKVSLSESASV